VLPDGRRPLLRVPGGGLRPASRRGRPADRDRRPHRARQGVPEPGGAGRPLVRRPEAGGARSLPGRAARRSFTGGRDRRAAGAMNAVSYESALLVLAAQNPDLIVMTAENRAPIRNLPAVLGPRFVDVGICEQTLIGAAAGLALRGRT